MKNWLMFWVLGGIWGSSFLLIKVGVEDLGTLPLVAVRVGLAALIMAVFLVRTGRHWPAGRRERLALIYVGLMNTAVPWLLITWGEQHIDSGLATVLNATVPLFTLVLVYFTLSDEPVTAQKAGGLLVGFLGVALLASRDVNSSSENSLEGQLAVLLASISYASSAIVIRRYLRGIEPLTTAGLSLVVGALPVVVITLVGVRLPAPEDVSLKAAAAAITLALFNTVIAYLLFYRLIYNWGATRTTMVTYAMPPVGVTLGALFLDETVDWKIIAGAVLILGGIIAANWRRRTPLPAASVAPAKPE